MRIGAASGVAFPLRFRIPEWTSGTSIRINGKEMQRPEAGAFLKVERTWNTADVVELEFPMRTRMVRGYNGSASIERGPLVFSFPVGEDWVKLRDRGMTADWQVFPSSQWNYALAIDESSIASAATKESPLGKRPFARQDTAVSLELQARKLSTWRAVDGVADPVPQSPVSSDEPPERITLIPYAAAKLRVTSFPVLKG